MMRFSATALLTSALGSEMHSSMDFSSSSMSRDYTVYSNIPVGEEALSKNGWHKHSDNGCDSHLGFAWTKFSSGPVHSQPAIVYTTAGGQQAGFGTVIMSWHGNPGVHPNQQKWTTDASSIVVGPAKCTSGCTGQFQINIAFRKGSIVCSGATDGNAVGDVLIVNPGGTHSMNLATTQDEAISAGWAEGSCFDSMGLHYFLDTSTHDGTLNYDGMPANLFPVTVMYDQGAVNAFFFSSIQDQVNDVATCTPALPGIQQGKATNGANGWEPLGLSNEHMCYNTCDADCDFGLPCWATMHIFLKDPKTVKCPAVPDDYCQSRLPFPGSIGCCKTPVWGKKVVQV